METAAHPRILFKPRTFGMIFVTLRSSASLRTGVVKTFRCRTLAFSDGQLLHPVSRGGSHCDRPWHWIVCDLRAPAGHQSTHLHSYGASSNFYGARILRRAIPQSFNLVAAIGCHGDIALGRRCLLWWFSPTTLQVLCGCSRHARRH